MDVLCVLKALFLTLPLLMSLLGVPLYTPPLSRDRQRGLMASLETELAEKMQQLQLLTAENEMLQLRASVLEAAVAGREEVVR
jgi:hypothetical protein